MFDSEFKLRSTCLLHLSTVTYHLSRKNKRMILIYLVSVKMLLSHIELVKNYHLMQFVEVTKAVSEGGILLKEALMKHKTFLYLLWYFPYP